MNDAFEIRMAKRVLKGMKGNTSPSLQQREVAKSCRLIISRRGTPDDVQRVRNYSGDKKGIASPIGAVTKRINKVLQPLSRFTEAVDSLSALKASGQGTTAAEQRLLKTVVGEFEKFRKSQFVKVTAKNVVKLFGRDPALAGAFLKSVGRITRGVGAVGAVGLGVLQGFEHFYQQRRLGAQATSRTIDATRALNTDARISGNIRRKALARVKAADFFTKNGTGIGVIDEYIENRRAQAAEEEAKKEADAIGAARPALQEFGLDPLTVLGEFARKRGKTVSNLTENERNDAIDNALIEKNRNDRNLKTNAEAYVAGELKKRLFYEEVIDGLRSEKGFEAKKEGLRQEYLNRVRTSAPKRLEERAAEAEKVEVERGMNSPVKNFLMEDRQQTARYMFRAASNRHQAWIDD
ncbi:MAG: hypothetical protein M5U26_23135 [Planctomycetota bacterium]|nr:hypothetical protein [Planctomycetota bacterium]